MVGVGLQPWPIQELIWYISWETGNTFVRKGKTGKKYVSKMSQIKNILKARENEKKKKEKKGNDE